ncbi:MAG: N-6 DNA methylase [Verrucomicrobia bacterium]|nr:N-6 DNA methylase [Verrucomicrobiota bacterium]
MKEQFFSKLELLIADARRLKTAGFGEQEPEAATCHELLLPLFKALGFRKENIKPEFKILSDSVDYLLKSERPLIFVEAKSLLDCPNTSLFEKHRAQVHRYIQNYRLSPEVTKMEQPVAWILLTNFDQLHFIRVNETAPTFSFKLDELWPRREELWELLALENLEANHIDELYDQQHKATLDQRFLADLKRWRLMLANGFALRNQTRPLEEIIRASQLLLNRFILCRMLETNRLIEWNKLARSYIHFEVFFGNFADKTFAEHLRESLFMEIKKKFNTELFEQPLLCDTLPLDNQILAMLVGHEPLSPEVAAQCGFESGQGELLAFRHLYNYDFSLMSQDVMGSVYERFLAHNLRQDGGRIVIEDTDELRKKEGIYYTPRYIVDYIVTHTLGEKIKPILAEAKALLGYKNFKDAFAKIREFSQIKVLDPAMGSGSFLLGAFDSLIAAYADYNAECQRHKKERNVVGTLFDAPDAIAEEVKDAALHVLTENLHGVDLDAQAVEVAKLNFWIRYMAVERDAMRERLRFEKGRSQALNLLPTLTANFKHGNSLIADKAVAGDTASNWATEFPKVKDFDVVIGKESGLLPNNLAIDTVKARAIDLAVS